MPELKRSLGLTQCTLMGVGVMLGAGIYALVGEAALLAGEAVWLSFLLAGVAATCTGLSYAELSSFIPKAGGSYYYANRAFGGHVAFLVSWLTVLGMSIAASAVALGFAGYLSALLPINSVFAASLLVVASTGLLIYGIDQSAWVAGACAALEVVGLVIVIAVGLPELGRPDYFSLPPTGMAGVLSAGALVFFAYIGFEDIAQLAEETRDATRIVPQAIMLSIAFTTLIYVMVAIAAVSVIPWQELGSSKSPLADVVAVAFGQRAFFVLSVIALFSTGNTVLILLMSASRMAYGMAEDGKLPAWIATIHHTRQSPYGATIVVGSISVGIVVALKHLLVVANVTNLTLLTAFAVVNAAVIVLRYREPAEERPFRIPVRIGRMPVIPLLGIVSSLFMMSFVGSIAFVVGIGLAAIGLLVHLLFSLRRSADAD